MDRSGADRPETPPGEELEGRLARALLPAAVRRRYAVKFALTLLLVVVVVAVVGAYTVLQVEGIVRADAEERLQSTANLQADNAAEWVATMHTQTLAVASAQLPAGNVDRIDAVLADLHGAADEGVAAIHYVNDSGYVAASTEPTAVGRTPRAISVAMAGPVERVAGAADPTAVEMSTSAYESRGEILVAFAARARSGAGTVVVVGNVGEDMGHLHADRDVVTTRILDPSGAGVLSPRRNTPAAVADTDAFRAALNGSTTLVAQGTRVVALAPVPGTPWVVTTAAPKDAVYAASRTVGRNVLVLLGVTLVTIGAIALLLGRQTVVPLVRLRERTEEMARGDLTVDLASRREDEIGQLYASLARMRDALAEQIQEAEAAREAAERSREELRRQNERLDQFASTVSHDLRNPLTVARGNLELVSERLDDDHQSRAELERIGESLDRMETIVDDVLALARDGADVETTAAVDLEGVAADAWASVDTGRATLTVREGATVQADPDRLQRLLENLFRNAVEHAGPDVTVTVGTTADGVFVADDGPGIDAEARDRIFEHGFTTSETGTGLGLSIVAEIAEAHGWDVTVTDSEAGGARFEFHDVFDSDTPA